MPSTTIEPLVVSGDHGAVRPPSSKPSQRAKELAAQPTPLPASPPSAKPGSLTPESRPSAPNDASSALPLSIAPASTPASDSVHGCAGPSPPQSQLTR